MAQAVRRDKPQGISILMCTIAYRDKLLDYALTVARRAAFDGVEIWGREPHTPEKFDENRMRATRKLLDAVQVTPYVLGSYLTFGATRNHEPLQLNDTLHIARWLKTPLVRVWASDVGGQEASTEVWERTVAEAQAAADRAAKLDMTLVVEMHSGTLADTAASAVRLMEAVARPNFKLNFQVPSHNDGQTAEERLRVVLPWVAHVHAQNYRHLPEHDGEPLQRAPLASGVFDYAPLIRILKDSGYRGAVAVEFAHDEHGDKEAALVEDLKYLRSICQ